MTLVQVQMQPTLPPMEKKKKWQKYGKHNVGDKTPCNSGNVQAL